MAREMSRGGMGKGGAGKTGAGMGTGRCGVCGGETKNNMCTGCGQPQSECKCK